MAELSNAVTVLIARMESHPEDFEVNEGELYSRSKFGEMVNGLYALTEVNPSVKNAFWYLNDADKQALVDAWKKYHYTKFEKKVMEKIFDDGSAEREAELEKLKQKVMMQQMQQQIYQRATQMPQPVTAMNAAQNAAGNTGLFGSGGAGLLGIFR